jgi:hypothetical protein
MGDDFTRAIANELRRKTGVAKTPQRSILCRFEVAARQDAGYRRVETAKRKMTDGVVQEASAATRAGAIRRASRAKRIASDASRTCRRGCIAGFNG